MRERTKILEKTSRWAVYAGAFLGVLLLLFLFQPRAGAVGNLMNGVVRATSLNLREQPSTSAKSLCLIPNSGVVLVIAVAEDDGEWSQVFYGDMAGYVKTEFIELVPIVEFEQTMVLRKGDQNELVKQAQQALRICGYDLVADGHFGDATEVVVKAFQRGNGLTDDGVLGAESLQKLLEMQLLAYNREMSASQNATADIAFAKGMKIENLDWFKEGKDVFGMGEVATCIDVLTGISFQVQRRGGTNHADVQPLTKEDTTAMLQARGSWSWSRRPLLVIVNGRVLAASWNGMPHGDGAIQGNNFNGHFCIHLLNSRTHGSNKVDAEHQTAIQQALAVGVL